MTIQSYRDLEVWRRGMDLAEATYRVTKRYPRDEHFGLTSQSRRAAASVPANIAEGYGRASRLSYLNFLRTAQGSLKELETHFILACRVGLLAEAELRTLLEDSDQLGRKLHRLIVKLQQHPGRAN